MPLQAWNHLLYFDPILGEDAICYQGFSGRGTYFIREPLAKMGKPRREQRARCLDLIEAAIEMDLAPGEVTLKEVPAHLRKEEDQWLNQSA